MTTIVEGSERVQYLTHLIRKMEIEDYTELADILFDIPFYSPIPMDANRSGDGIYMRETFIEENTTPEHPEEYDALSNHLNCECSMLEFLVTFAERTEDQMSYVNPPQYWFRYFIKNLGLAYFSDDNFKKERNALDFYMAIDDRIERFLERDYNYDGSGGGIIIIRNPPCDLRTTAYWWQLQYLVAESEESDN